MPDLEELQRLLRDRQSPKATTGRASAPFPLVMNADLAVDLQQAEMVFAAAQDDVALREKEAAGDSRVGGTKSPALTAAQAELRKAQKALDEAKAAANEVTIQMVITALTSNDYDELLMKHPPRDDDENDKALGYNQSTFPEALLQAAPAKILDLDDNPLPGFEKEDLIDGMTHGERDLARRVATGLNAQVFSVPFSAVNSPSRQRSGGKPKRR